MTPAAFRKLALSMFEALEGSHMDQADFRVGGKIFATLPAPRHEDPTVQIGMIRLTPQQQAQALREHPEVFFAAPGSWGRQGCTFARLGKLKIATARIVLNQARANTAPKAMLDALGHGAPVEARANRSKAKRR